MDDKQHQDRRRTPARRSQFAELVANGRKEMSKPAREAIGHLYAALLTMPELKLSDGVTARVEPYTAPEISSDGRLHCGIDIRLSNGDMLEFTLKNTGWGKSFAKRLDPPSEESGRAP
jgi:hypothetical protein